MLVECGNAHAGSSRVKQQAENGREFIHKSGSLAESIKAEKKQTNKKEDAIELLMYIVHSR